MRCVFYSEITPPVFIRRVCDVFDGEACQQVNSTQMICASLWLGGSLCIFVDLCGSLDSLWIFVDLSEYVVDLCGMLLICERIYWISVELFVDPYNYGSLWIGVGIRGSLWISVYQWKILNGSLWITGI